MNLFRNCLIKKPLKTDYIHIIPLLFSIVLCCTNAVGQNDETLNWYFGEYAGLSFIEQQDPLTLSNGQLLAPAGCATISDIYGNLQMYTNGDKILNKNHSIMNNGLLVTLDPSGPTAIQPNSGAAQNSIIVPIMDIPNLYYVFTVGPNGLLYSVVDMSLLNGLGSVIEVNNNLLPLSGLSKLNAVHHADGKSLWLMTTKQNEGNEYSSFYAYKIHTDGSIDPPVITSSEVGYLSVIEGTMKFSPNGEKIACANYRSQTVENHLTLFDFNNQTGMVSNKRNLLTALGFFEIVSVYGVEFSNDSKYLYATTILQGLLDTSNPNAMPAPGDKTNFLYQYNLESFIPQQYITILHQETNNLAPSSLQLSRNGKIYRALSKSSDGTDFLGVINAPDVLGVGSNYTHNAINLDSNESRRGLPNFIQSYFRTRIINKGACLNELIPFEVDTYANITSAQWDFGDGNTSNEIAPNYSYAVAGNYNVSVSITVNNRQIKTAKDIVVYELPDLTADQELEQCDDDEDGISVFDLSDIVAKITNPDLNESLIFYETFEDAQDDTDNIPNPNNYTSSVPNQEVFVRVVNENNCYAITSFFLRAIYVELGFIPEMYACDESDGVPDNLNGLFYLGPKRDEIQNQFGLSDSTTLSFYPTLLDAQTTQNEIADDRYVSQSTIIWVRVTESDLSCAGLAPISLIVNDQPVITIEDTYLICTNTSVVLFGAVSNSRYEWLNSDSEIISIQQQFSTTTTGTYTHIAYKTENGLECSSSKVFTIESVDPPVFNIIEVDTTPNDNSNFIYVSIYGSGTYEFSLDNNVFYEGLNEYTFYDVPAGAYTVYVRDIGLCEPTIQQEVYIMGYPKFFTPNNDGINDFWEIKGLEENSVQSIQIFDRFGKLLAILEQSNYFRWYGAYDGKELPSNDYWFKVIFNSGFIDSGHFTLKR